MFRRGLSRHAPLLFAALLAVLLAVLATLQYRWIGQVSMMQRHRMHFTLFSAGTQLAEDFDLEVTRAWRAFLPEARSGGGAGPEDLAERMERWRAEAPYPGLVRDIIRVRRTSDGELGAEILRPGAREFEPAAWPADLQDFRRHLTGGLPHRALGLPVLEDVPALVISAFPMRRRDPGERFRGQRFPSGEILILRLDERTIREEILPELSRRYFGEPQERDYSVAVVSPDEPGRVIFQSDPGVSPAALRSGGDASLPIFSLRPFREPHGVRMRVPGSPADPSLHQREGGSWRLVLLRRHGTLENAVAHFRYKNMGISGGILLLLAAAATMMMVSSQRVQKLARQQIELVAGVTHELHTPITAIRSAGQNLADGVVADPAQVKRYGTLIESEGQRLSRMVGQMLELAGLQSGQATYTLQPTEIEEALDGALADCRWLLDERQAQVEKDIDPALPAVLGDAGALRRALRNLVENAAKYGGRSPWIGVRARAAGREVAVTVEDRGPGIRREDLPHLFEPFYRGREVKTGGIPGSGLGLSVVRRIAEAHHGRVSVDAGGAGQGAAFTLHLPIAPGEPA